LGGDVVRISLPQLHHPGLVLPRVAGLRRTRLNAAPASEEAPTIASTPVISFSSMVMTKPFAVASSLIGELIVTVWRQLNYDFCSIAKSVETTA
jgi:hypothetical protein